jgi:hypothetical protein
MLQRRFLSILAKTPHPPPWAPDGEEPALDPNWTDVFLIAEIEMLKIEVLLLFLKEKE